MDYNRRLDNYRQGKIDTQKLTVATQLLVMFATLGLVLYLLVK